MSAYAISDIHGCCKTFEKLLFELIKLEPSDKLFLLGDYIDRGPRSKEVIDLILKLKSDGYQISCLKGNHEFLLLKSVQEKENYIGWYNQGGKETLQSFGLEQAFQLSSKYIQFFEELEYYASYKNYLLVHGGFNFELDDIFLDQKAMLWARYYQVDPNKTENRTVVHGHTPITQSELNSCFEADNFEINLDNGCVYTSKEGMGNLYAINLDANVLIHCPYCD